MTTSTTTGGTGTAPRDPPGAPQGSPRRCAPGAILCTGLTRRFGPTLALAPLDLEVGPGGVTGLLGPNGSGKSTLMRCLTGLVPRDAGTVWVDGVQLAGDGLAVRQRLTYSPGELHLYGEMRGGEHLDWLLRGRDREARSRARTHALDMGLPLGDRVRGYSHGMKRQLLFAAAIAPRVRVRILDEPTEGLDPTRRSQVLELLERDAAGGATVLLSSHHLGEVDRVCERLVFMSQGRLIADETPESVHGRAARVVRLGWPAGTDLDGVEGKLAAVEQLVESVQREGTHVTLQLSSRDPRPFLAALAGLDLPAPSSVEHGRLSLGELYQHLYGVEGT